MLKFLFGIFLIGYGFYKTLVTDPVWGIYLFAALTHIRLNQLGENIALPLQVPIVIACLSLVMYLASDKYRNKFSKWPPEVFLLGLMVAGMAVSSTGAFYNPAMSWDFTQDYAKYLVFFILFIHLVDSLPKIEWFHRTLILSSAYLVYRCWDLRGISGPRFDNYGGGVISDANHFAAALVLLFPFVFQKTMDKNRWVAVAAGILCFGMIMSVFISGSRGGFLGLVAVFGLLFLNFKSQRKKILVTASILCLLAIFNINEYQKDRVRQLFTETTKDEMRDDSAQSRLDFWKLSYDLFQQNKWTGVGVGNFRYYSGPTLEGKAEGEPGHVAHSLWFEMLAEGGLLVTAPFLILLYRFFRNSKRLLRQCKLEHREEEALYLTTVRVALGGFLVSATFLNRLIYEPIYWCIALVVVHGYFLHESAEVLSTVEESEICAELQA